ncbi:putative ribosomal protein S25.e.c7 [Fusarium austroafricanum]|uniref:40S ribosomal protein S25 n=1 Tax=Fusarium austroafricanum TaxID=2364996 RepID=A0A8H4KLH0_9HYPO|nr:putative ribosomal protein S25.e.c7 [Fusarium austroafricanum]
MAPAAGAKKQKKKWSKGKVKDKAQHAVVLDKTTSEKLYKDVQSYRLVTIATLVDRMKINGSLARQCLADLEEKGIIKPVVTHSKMKIYSMAAFPFPRELPAPMRCIRTTANLTSARAVGGSD